MSRLVIRKIGAAEMVGAAAASAVGPDARMARCP